MDGGYVSAEEAAALLGVSLTTVYAYVSRKGLRSIVVPGSRQRRYWRADIERLRRKKAGQPPITGELKAESAITLITDNGPFYRGRSVIDLGETASLEEAAALLWGVEPDQVFTPEAPRTPEIFRALTPLLAAENDIDRAAALFPFLEQANPRAFDLSPMGTARAGADVLRGLATIILRRDAPTSASIHLTVGSALDLSEQATDLVRRLLVLSADHGFEPSTFAVRAIASMGVTPWRSVATGLSVSTGRHSRFGYFDAVQRFVSEIIGAGNPIEPVVRRLREGETLPGFVSAGYPKGDPRAASLFAACPAAFGDDLRLARLTQVIDLVRELRGLKPNFAFIRTFIGLQVGLSSGEPLFLLGRSAGWIAHAIEQYRAGEAEKRELFYSGPLPIGEPETEQAEAIADA